MKPILIQVPKHGDYSFRVSMETTPNFYNPFHFHEELEFTYVLKSSGTRFVGDSIEPFNVDDAVLVGSQLPHCWINDVAYFQGDPNYKAQAIVIQFKPDFAGSLFNLYELQRIKQFIKKAEHGIKFLKNAKPVLKQMLLDLVNSNGAKRISLLIDLLEFMANTEHKETLCKTHTLANMSSQNLDRLNAIFEYTLQNYKEHITLQDISALAHLSPNAFCRYFKKHTRKTYKEFVNELKIAQACKLMQETSKSITEIAFSSGFNNVSHFIRVFKKFKQVKPLEYRKNIETT
ncbi:AraC family transcriptional regulator [Flavivirga eckloniae]|uniref:AraC family transcriptional regulator n=1 Tax=Flavivirga eckloniae TaxID=1803846 RepID=A0A2K9PUB6_9FLAO|nr:AraC family transcriptional regulator [Flavivirga eckloniae]AUP80652.1 AraC family transcriptional regulator [Flavivirga eckloniae]